METAEKQSFRNVSKLINTLFLVTLFCEFMLLLVDRFDG